MTEAAETPELQDNPVGSNLSDDQPGLSIVTDGVPLALPSGGGSTEPEPPDESEPNEAAALPIQDWRRCDPWSTCFHKVADIEDSLRYFDCHFGILVESIIQCIQALVGRDHMAPFVETTTATGMSEYFSILDRGLEEIMAKLREQKDHVNLIITEVINHAVKEINWGLGTEQRQLVLDNLTAAAEHLKEADIGIYNAISKRLWFERTDKLKLKFI